MNPVRNGGIAIDLDSGLLVRASGGSGGSGGSGSAGAVTFYTCVSVDASSKTWSGKAWTWDAETGCWIKSQTVTEGLIYGEQFVPEVNKIYDAGATIRLTSLYDYSPGVEGAVPEGAVVSIPFADSLNPATGQAILDSEGTVTFETVQGWKCAHFKDGATVKYSLANLDGYRNYSVSFWFYVPENPADIQADGKFRCLFDTYNSNDVWARASFVLDGENDQGARQLHWKGSSTMETGFFVRGWNHVILNAANGGSVVSSNDTGDIWINGVKYKENSNLGVWCLTPSWLRVAGHKASEFDINGGFDCPNETKADSLYVPPDVCLGPLLIYARHLTDSECQQLWASRKPDVPDNPIFWLPGNDRDPWVGTFASSSWNWFGIAEGIYYAKASNNSTKAWNVPGLTSLTQWTCHARIYPLERTNNQTFGLMIGGQDVYLGGVNRVGFGYTMATVASPWGGAGIFTDGVLQNDTSKCTTDTSQGHYCTLTYDGTTVRSYLDGELIEELELSGFTFGENAVYTAPYASTNLMFADVRIYPSCLTAAQVLALTKVLDPQVEG